MLPLHHLAHENRSYVEVVFHDLEDWDTFTVYNLSNQ